MFIQTKNGNIIGFNDSNKLILNINNDGNETCYLLNVDNFTIWRKSAYTFDFESRQELQDEARCIMNMIYNAIEEGKAIVNI